MLTIRTTALLTMLLTLAMAAAAQPARTSVGSQLSAVLVARTDGGVRVTIRGSGRVVPEVVAAVGQLPPRIVIDFGDVVAGEVAARTSGMDDLLAVRVETRANGAARVTLDLDRPMTYHVVPTPVESGTLMIDLARRTPGETVQPSGSGTRAFPVAGASPLVSAAAAARATTTAAEAERTSQVPLVRPPVPSSTGFGTTSPGPRPTGRAAFYTHAARVGNGDTSRSSAEFASSLTYRLPERTTDGMEYGLDLRHTASTIDGRPARLSIYDGFVGHRLGGGRVGLRAGHMWLNDLGGLGALAGGLVEVRQPASQTTPIGSIRGGVFGGLEPRIYEAGYADEVRKIGGYVTVEGARSRRHVLGYVRINHGDVVERSAFTFANYVPYKAFSVYQAGEYDLTGPGGAGSGGLTYFFANARATLGPRVELLGTFNRGRSIDSRGISDDILNGRPVSQRAIEGLLYQSMGGRVTVEVVPRVRVYAGYSRDRNNRDDRDSGRWLVGGYASNLFGSGLDFTVSDSRIERPTGNYHSTYLSLGRQIGRRLYVNADYTTSLALVRFVRGDGVIIDLRPQTSRFGASGVLTLSRTLSLLVTAEETIDGDVTELRILSGLSVRFP